MRDSPAAAKAEKTPTSVRPSSAESCSRPNSFPRAASPRHHEIAAPDPKACSNAHSAPRETFLRLGTLTTRTRSRPRHGCRGARTLRTAEPPRHMSVPEAAGEPPARQEQRQSPTPKRETRISLRPLPRPTPAGRTSSSAAKPDGRTSARATLVRARWPMLSNRANRSDSHGSYSHALRAGLPVSRKAANR